MAGILNFFYILPEFSLCLVLRFSSIFIKFDTNLIYSYDPMIFRSIHLAKKFLKLALLLFQKILNLVTDYIILVNFFLKTANSNGLSTNT